MFDRPVTPTLYRLLAVTTLLAVTACNGDGTSAPEPVTTTSSVPTTRTTPPPSIEPASRACTISTPDPGGEVADLALSVDADGDGLDDEAEVRIIDDVTLALVVAFGAGGRGVAVFADDSVSTVGAPRVERAVDLDGDGDEDLWVVVGAGASVEVVTLITPEGCGLLRPGAGSSANAFPVGASAGSTAGVECVDDDGNGTFDAFLTHEGGSDDAVVYEGRSTRWTVDGAVLTPEEADGFRVDASRDDFGPYASIDC